MKIYEYERPANSKKGLVDGAHEHLPCSNCSKPLVDLWVVKPDAVNQDGSPMEWNVQASCCYCGDKSYLKKLRGRFGYDGYGLCPDKDNPEYKKMSTHVTTIETLKDRLVFHTAKVQ